jgi:cell wall assembly regulator SMI1
VQKFTRPLTREIELAGDRLAVTFSAEGLSVRPVGSRKPPREITWPALLALVAGARSAPNSPTQEELAAVLKVFKTGATAAPAATAAAATTAPAAASQTPAPPAAAGQGGIAGLLARLERWLHQHRPRFLKGLKPGASAADLDSLEKASGQPLPADLRALLAWHNGQNDDFVGCFEENWYLMDTQQIAEAWREQTGSDATKAVWQKGWIPFLDDDRDNYTFLDTTQPGQPVRQFWKRNPEQQTVAPSLAAWLEHFVTGVEAGKYTVEEERGAFMRAPEDGQAAKKEA